MNEQKWIQFGRWAGHPGVIVPEYNLSTDITEAIEQDKVAVTMTTRINEWPGERPSGPHVAFVNIMEPPPEYMMSGLNEVYRVVPQNFDLNRINLWWNQKRQKYDTVSNFERYYLEIERTQRFDQAWIMRLFELVCADRLLVIAVVPEFNLNRFSMFWMQANLLISIIQPFNTISPEGDF